MELLNIINNIYSKINIYYGIIICYDKDILNNVYDLLLKNDYPIYKFNMNDNFDILKNNYRLFIVYEKDLLNFDKFNNISIIFRIKRGCLYVLSNQNINNFNKYNIYNNLPEGQLHSAIYYKTDFYINI